MKILILGVNGFIGSALTEKILTETDWHVYGMDLDFHKILEWKDHPRFHFFEGDILINKEWIAYHIKKCDVVFPLVAIATPALYVKEPLRVFELDFEANLNIVRQCVLHKKRIIFPSTSEVYGMCQDSAFDEETSPLVMGPINKQRWIYACSKQLLDRVIYAYGIHAGLDYTLFRPFNWIGPKLDHILSQKEGSSRVLTQFIGDILQKRELTLVDGGHQKRCFMDIEDGVRALMKIIENPNGVATSQIFNLGNPDQNFSVRELAIALLQVMKTFPGYESIDEQVTLLDNSSGEHYGNSYQDILHRVPNIDKARNLLGWSPTIDLHTSLKKTLAYHLDRWSENL